MPWSLRPDNRTPHELITDGQFVAIKSNNVGELGTGYQRHPKPISLVSYGWP